MVKYFIRYIITVHPTQIFQNIMLYVEMIGNAIK